MVLAPLTGAGGAVGSGTAISMARLGNYLVLSDPELGKRILLASGQAAGRGAIERALCFENHSPLGSWWLEARRFFRSERGGGSRSGQYHPMQNSCIMTTRRDQHEAVPYCVVERQRPPEMKAGPDRIEHAANSDQNRRLNVYRA